jgi:hypothetical protein
LIRLKAPLSGFRRGQMLTLSNNATAVYNSSSGKFVYTLAASQDTADLKVNGYSGSITDAAGNALVKLASVSLTTLMPRPTCADASGLSAGPSVLLRE